MYLKLYVMTSAFHWQHTVSNLHCVQSYTIVYLGWPPRLGYNISNNSNEFSHSKLWHLYFKRTKMALFNKNKDINSTRHFLCKHPKHLKYLYVRLYDFIKFIILNKDIWIWILTWSCYSRLRSKKNKDKE